MATRSNRGLSIGSFMMQQSRKYLGEPHDPHFIPSEPLVDRPVFSAEEELALMRACASALARVPHSDDMADDPFRYLGKHIVTKTQTRTKEVPNKRTLQRAKIPEPLTNITTREATTYDTATPSETSKRETLGTTGSTPLTTPGLSPEETGKRFSDAARTISTASHSNLKTELRPAKGDNLYSFLKSPLTKSRPQAPVASKSLTHLPSSGVTPVQRAADSDKSDKEDPFGTPDFNKSLPSLPRNRPTTAKPDAPSSEKAGVFSRLFRTKTTQPQHAQPSVTVQVRATVPSVAQAGQEDDLNAESHTKRKRFNITAILNKPNAAYSKRATVG